MTAVIVAYKSRELLPRALDPLKSCMEEGLLDCIVVDNDSRDGIKELVERDYPEVDLIENEKNIGFGSACNVGMRRARSEYILLLNPDAILSRAALLVLLDYMDEHPKVGIVGPSIKEEDGYLNPIGDLPSPREILSQYSGIFRKPDARTPIKPGSQPMQGKWLCGAVMLLRSKMLEQIGCFDPRFFLYFEETDLCKRASDAGWQIWGVGESIAYHVMAASSRSSNADKFHGCIAEHYFRSRYYYLVKHFGSFRAFTTEAVELLLILVTMPWRSLRGRDSEQEWVRLRAPKFSKPAMPLSFEESQAVCAPCPADPASEDGSP